MTNYLTNRPYEPSRTWSRLQPYLLVTLQVLRLTSQQIYGSGGESEGISCFNININSFPVGQGTLEGYLYRIINLILVLNYALPVGLCARGVREY